MARLKCQRCSTTFDGRSDAKYCGDSCRSAAAKEGRQSRAKPFPGGAGRRSTALTSALTKATRKAERTAADGAAFALARAYARQLDADPDALSDLGPKYLNVLMQLNMTPGSRGTSSADRARGGDQVDLPTAALDEISRRREERRARTNRAADLDAPAGR